jgi:hypothetical protein
VGLLEWMRLAVGAAASDRGAVDPNFIGATGAHVHRRILVLGHVDPRGGVAGDVGVGTQAIVEADVAAPWRIPIVDDPPGEGLARELAGERLGGAERLGLRWIDRRLALAPAVVEGPENLPSHDVALVVQAGRGLVELAAALEHPRLQEPGVGAHQRMTAPRFGDALQHAIEPLRIDLAVDLGQQPEQRDDRRGILAPRRLHRRLAAGTARRPIGWVRHPCHAPPGQAAAWPARRRGAKRRP